MQRLREHCSTCRSAPREHLAGHEPFWPLLFKNIRIDFLGSDDFTAAQKGDAARAINDALQASWEGMPIAERFSLEVIAIAHERLETTRPRGRVIVWP